MSKKLLIKSRLKNYEVSFVDGLAEPIKASVKRGDFLFIDEKVDKLYGEKLRGLFAEGSIIALDASEQNKTIDNCYRLIESLIEKNIRKNNTIFALGGGVIEDIAGFISSVIYRGIDWIFCPTTLLAQADSCIGSKTSINMGKYKNLLGSFYPPSKVFIDTDFLKSLPQKELKSGIGEMLHFFLIDGNKRLAETLMADYNDLLSSPGDLKEYIIASLKIKKEIIEIDELDRGERNLFNYGHTFGHAIETVTGYAINHGQAVTMGMDIANYLSLKLGYIDKKAFDDMHKILDKNIPDFKLEEDHIDDYLKTLSRDKKNIGKELGCILTKGHGKMMRMQIPMDGKLKSIIKSYFEESGSHAEDIS